MLTKTRARLQGVLLGWALAEDSPLRRKYIQYLLQEDPDEVYAKLFLCSSDLARIDDDAVRAVLDEGYSQRAIEQYLVWRQEDPQPH